MKYYVNLYSPGSTATGSAITDFFKSIEMPTLSTDARNLFNTAFTIEEMISALQSFPNGKALALSSFRTEVKKKCMQM